VELAGSIAELARFALKRDFRNIDPTKARVILLEAGPHLLAALRRLREGRDECLLAIAGALPAQRLLSGNVMACSNTCREDVGGAGPRLPGTPKRRRVGLSRRSSGECRVESFLSLCRSFAVS
jgi:hypothetical protein